MTQQQQADLKLWKEDQSQPLPASLENVLLEDCLEGLKKEDVINTKYKKLGFSGTYDKQNDNEYIICFNGYMMDNKNLNIRPFKKGTLSFLGWSDTLKTCAIQTLLSRTPDGEAVMPFLGMDTQEVQAAKGASMPNYVIEKIEVKTLDHLLYQEFTEALRLGKGFYGAYQAINLIYLQNAYLQPYYGANCQLPATGTANLNVY
jgi:hypothetical protein